MVVVLGDNIKRKIMTNYVELELNKFYYGSTILLLGYRHEKYGYKFTTVSSSYTLGNKILLGLGATSDAYQQIKKYNHFSVNIIGHSNLELIEAGAQNPAKDRLRINSDVKYDIDKESDVPLIDGVLAQFICTRIEDFRFDSSIINVAATINKRLFNSAILENGKVKKEKLDTVLFFADIDGEYIK